MSSDTLFIYALPDAPDVRCTALTRATETSDAQDDLPPLAEWLGVQALDLDRVELFPTDDLGEMPLVEYATMVFAPEKMPDTATKARLNALEGMVLLVPGAALDGTPTPGAQVESVAEIALAIPDHRANLPKAELGREYGPDAVDDDDDDDEYQRRKARRKVIAIVVTFSMLAFLLWRRFLS